MMRHQSDMEVAHLWLPPELLLLVMKQVQHGEQYSASRKSLLNATLVNREWAEAATHILWEKGASVSALASVSADRRQYYANKISELDFEGEEDAKHHATFKDLIFPRLKSVFVDKVDLEEGEKLHLNQYLQPQLRSIDCGGGGLDDNALVTMAANCPRLEELWLEEPIEGSSEHQLLELFRGCKLLELVNLGDGWADVVTAELFAGLASLESLRQMSIRPLTEDLAIRKGVSMASFRNLESLTMTVASVSVARVASVVTSLSSLILIIEDSDNDALAPLGSLKDLVHLELTFLDDTELSPQGFRALENLRRLEILMMESRGAPLSAMWMNDKLFNEFTSKLPKLRNLELKVDFDITAMALTSLAKTHPKMNSIDFFGEFEFSEWSRITKPLYPSLIRFVIEAPFIEGRTRRYVTIIYFCVHIQVMLKSSRSADATVEERASQIADLIIRHCPVVKQLSFYSYYENLLAQLVIRAFEAKVPGRYHEPLSTWFRDREDSARVPFQPSETRMYHG
ncbi:unnamed protein product [Aureobasidium vineae]|uniref:F-box domain-containing protein n=1 Tax=Aureobasidium vineae TaxID=2773715 RepID=A0A9N8K1S5_9PEZI|nr:unnamed protein product [Aureobasidium vineae]